VARIDRDDRVAAGYQELRHLVRGSARVGRQAHDGDDLVGLEDLAAVS